MRENELRILRAIERIGGIASRSDVAQRFGSTMNARRRSQALSALVNAGHLDCFELIGRGRRGMEFHLTEGGRAALALAMNDKGQIRVPA